MSDTKVLRCKQELPAEILELTPSIEEQITRRMVGAVGQKPVDAICGGEYIVLMDKPQVENAVWIDKDKPYQNSIKYICDVRITEIVRCKDCISVIKYVPDNSFSASYKCNLILYPVSPKGCCPFFRRREKHD